MGLCAARVYRALLSNYARILAVGLLKQRGFYVKLQRPNNNSKRIELIAWNLAVQDSVTGRVRQPTGLGISRQGKNTVTGGKLARHLGERSESERLADGDAESVEKIPNTGTGTGELRRI